jgi:hypothetical protein
LGARDQAGSRQNLKLAICTGYSHWSFGGPVGTIDRAGIEISFAGRPLELDPVGVDRGETKLPNGKVPLSTGEGRRIG